MANFDEFVKRSKGYLLESKIEILANLFLVKNGGRKAYLFESANFGIQARDLLQDIDIVYPEFKRTLENFVAKRYLFHTKPIPARKFGEDYDIWLGKVLGFDCPGDLIYKDTEITYGINYYITNGDNRVQIFAQICRENIGLSKLDFWNSIFANSSWTVKGKVKSLIPNIVFQKKVEGKDVSWIKENQTKFFMWLNGNGLEFVTETIVENGIEKSFDLFYDYILIEILAEKFHLFDTLYPLTENEFGAFDELRKTLWKKFLNETPSKPITYLKTILNDELVKSIRLRTKTLASYLRTVLEKITFDYANIRL